MFNKLKELFSNVKNKVTTTIRKEDPVVKGVVAVGAAAMVIYSCPDKAVTAIFGACWLVFLMYVLVIPVMGSKSHDTSSKSNSIH